MVRRRTSLKLVEDRTPVMVEAAEEDEDSNFVDSVLADHPGESRGAKSYGKVRDESAEQADGDNGRSLTAVKEQGRKHNVLGGGRSLTYYGTLRGLLRMLACFRSHLLIWFRLWISCGAKGVTGKRASSVVT